MLTDVCCCVKVVEAPCAVCGRVCMHSWPRVNQALGACGFELSRSGFESIPVGTPEQMMQRCML